mgnify:CR=1 FL=1
MTPFSTDYLLKGSASNYSPIGIRASTYAFGRHNSVHNKWVTGEREIEGAFGVF